MEKKKVEALERELDGARDDFKVRVNGRSSEDSDIKCQV